MEASLEICVESPAGARCAELGGADRVELCEGLAVEGLTPSEETLRAAREACALPIFAMLRPRPGDFLYTPLELARMEASLDLARECGMNGFVLGALREDEVDRIAVARLVERASGLPVTFHRAFDHARDRAEALERLVELGVRRVLTTGGSRTAEEGAGELARLVEQAADRITILVGGGVRAANVRALRARTGAFEFHSSLGGDGAITTAGVRELVARLRADG